MGRTSERLTPRSRAKRDQVLAAARDLFLERGFSGASMDAIARTAGVSKETLYRHFRNKESLLADCLRSLVLDLAMDDVLVAGGSRPVESHHQLRATLVELADGLVDRLMKPEYLGLMRVVINESPRLPQLGDVYRSAVPETAIRSFIRILRRAEEGGVARVSDHDAAARMFIGPLLSYVLSDGLIVGDGPIHRPTTDRIEAIVDLYLRAITP